MRVMKGAVLCVRWGYAALVEYGGVGAGVPLP
jgi:hypothetical protein